MKNNKTTNQLFKTAQLRVEAMHIDDVHSLISSYKDARKNRCFNFKNGFIMFTSIITISLIIFNWPSTEVAYEAKVENRYQTQEKLLTSDHQQKVEVFVTQTSHSSNSSKPETIRIEPISPELIEISSQLGKGLPVFKETDKTTPIQFNWNDERFNFKISRSSRKTT